MRTLTSLIIGQFFLISNALAATDIGREDIGFKSDAPASQILTNSGGNITFIHMLTMIQSILLKVVLPVVVIGASLYIAYELFTADGDESRLKRAWKSVTYSVVALIAIALSYAFVTIISRISI